MGNRVNEAKLHDVIPLVAGTAERGALFPTPDLNQRVQRLDTGCIQRWNGTEWVDLLCAGEGGGGEFIQADYVVINLSDDLTSERRLQVGAGLTMVDGGANGDVTLLAACPNYCGNGSPEGVVTAAVGSWYLQRDAASTTHPLWAKRTGSGNTGWVAYAGHRGTGTQSLSLGDSSTATATNAQSFGQSAAATAADTLAVGRSAAASASGAQAIGLSTSASATDAIAIGTSTTASGASAVTLGKSSTNAAVDAVAIGRGVSVGAAAVDGVAIGREATLDPASTGKTGAVSGIAIGNTHAVNTEEINIGSRNLGVGGNNGAYGCIYLGNDIAHQAQNHIHGTILIGLEITAESTNTFCAPIAIGEGAYLGGTDNIVIGSAGIAHPADNPVAGLHEASVGVGIGQNVSLNGDCIVALGHDSMTRGDFCVAIGPHARAGEDQTTDSCNALGRFATALGHRGTAIGYNATVASGHTGSVALGFNALTTAAGQLAIGSVDQQITSIVMNGGASGTNIAGSDLALAPGLGTGAGTPGAIVLKAAPALGSGTTLQTAATVVTVDSTGANLASGKVLKVAGTPVVGAQGAAVADATNGTDVITQLNSLLARLRTHGLIAT